jgi:CheY-like chemotaxis protein
VTNKQLSGSRVLVVEDEMMVLMLIEGLLADFGCESVTTAATVDQALALIAVQTFDVAMLDVTLNGHESYRIADALVARGVPFFFATGYSRRSMNAAYCDRPVLHKPFQREKLVDMLTRLLSA